MTSLHQLRVRLRVPVTPSDRVPPLFSHGIGTRAADNLKTLSFSESTPQHPSAMHKSLCHNDFYPLIRNNSKWMSYAEKAAYRIKHSIPSTVDEWIMGEMMHTNAPTANPYACGQSRKYSLLQDTVECTFNVLHHKEVSAYQGS